VGAVTGPVNPFREAMRRAWPSAGSDDLAPEVRLVAPSRPVTCATGEVCGDRHPETGRHVVRELPAGEDTRPWSMPVKSQPAPPPPRIQRCDGLCPGDDCYACARAADAAAERRALAEQVEALAERVAALEAEVLGLIETNKTLKARTP
jgi:hypothetical protein